MVGVQQLVLCLLNRNHLGSRNHVLQYTLQLLGSSMYTLQFNKSSAQLPPT